MNDQPSFHLPRGSTRHGLPAYVGAAEIASVAPCRLSLLLREETAELHREIERKIGLPAAILSLSHYRSCLVRFYGIYEPMETLLASFTDWPQSGVSLPLYSQSARIARDLAALGPPATTAVCATEAALPELPDFAHALGALYVMEGAALGSQFMLRHLTERLGQSIAGADTFFRGRGPATAEHWTRFRALLDGYGAKHPNRNRDVVEGARSTFRAIGDWMHSGAWTLS
jgi:heme oxygenase